MQSLDDLDDLLDRAATLADSLARRPESTYRIQFHSGFTFRDATAIVPYLASLGITHLYASPYLKAQPGSTHGYDVIDHCSLNPELGTQADYDTFAKTLLEHGLSQVLDTVPNHAGVATNENNWWNDALEYGPDGRYGRAFDIGWTHSSRADLQNRVLLPILGKPYEEELKSGELKLLREDVSGKHFVGYYKRRFPIDPKTIETNADVAAINSDPDRLGELLDKQHYRLAYWKVGPDEINYRRFFDVNDLAALAMERQEVFDETHALTLRLVAEGKVSGLRIDHPDGLSDPLQYLNRLHRYLLLACAEKLMADDGKSEAFKTLRPRLVDRIETLSIRSRPLYVLGEKILAMDERLDTRWPVDGTTGYRFLNMINGLFIDPAGDTAFTDLYSQLTGCETDLAKIVHEKKRLILATTMASELTMLTDRISRIAMRTRSARDISRRVLNDTLADVVACFGVYRTYIISDSISDIDVMRIDQAIETSKKLNPHTDALVYTFLRDVLLQKNVAALPPDERAEQLTTAIRFQQLTSPVMAKGVEDTAFYAFNRLVSLNEVGGDPATFGLEPHAVHAYLDNRQQHWPHAMSTLSTHDTKRSEDVRARLNVLSEIPARWQQAMASWMKLNGADHADLAAGPTANEEYLLYQAMLGIWPMNESLAQPSDEWIERINAYLLKAMREAKENTLWTQPNEPHEKSVSDFVERICSVERSGEFLRVFDQFVKPVAAAGFINSLSQTVLKLTAPGMPDTYQGTELWDFSLVDPDNRRPVDYGLRRHAVDSLRALVNAHRNDLTGVARDLISRLPDGHAKLWITQSILQARRDHPKLFTQGRYASLQIKGAKADHVFAFVRDDGERSSIVVVPRLAYSLSGDAIPIGEKTWGDTEIVLASNADRKYRNLFTGESLPSFRLAKVLAHFPVAVFVSSAT